MNCPDLDHTLTPEPCRLCRHFHGRSYGGNYLACAMNPLGPTDGHCPDREQLGPDAPPTARVLPMQPIVDLREDAEAMGEAPRRGARALRVLHELLAFLVMP
jgi:hypothetical protein